MTWRIADADRNGYRRPELGAVAVRVVIASDSDIVTARQQGRALADALDFSATDSAFIATVVSELARVLLTSSPEGEIRIEPIHEPGRSGVLIVASAAGQGRQDVPAPNGHGHHGSAAPPLADLHRLVDELVVTGEPRNGATVTAIKWRR